RLCASCAERLYLHTRFSRPGPKPKSAIGFFWYVYNLFYSGSLHKPGLHTYLVSVCLYLLLSQYYYSLEADLQQAAARE
ncbi:hypothetical protein CC78DRAFT_504026, partial [Lojkania enalia]